MGLRISKDIASAAKPNWRVPFKANIDRTVEDVIDAGAYTVIFGVRRYRFFNVRACLADQAPNSRARAPSGSIFASSRSRLWPHKEYCVADSVTSRLCCSNARTLL